MLNLTIRKASLDDLINISDLFRKAVLHMSEMGLDQWDELYPNETDFIDDIENQELYAGFIKDTLMSAAVLTDRQYPEYSRINWKFKARKVCVIHRVCVSPDAHRKGLGTQTVTKLEQLAKAQGYSIVRLDTHSKNSAALNFYESLGYHSAGDITLKKGIFHCFEKPLT